MKLSFFLIVCLFSLVIVSCKDDDPVNKPGALSFHMHTLVDATDVESYGDTILLLDGRQITVSLAQLYISNIKLIKTDGGVIDGPSSPILMQQGIEEYDLGDVASGNYKSVRFDVGLSDATNLSNPSTSDPVLYQPSMWFGATAQPGGFVFFNFQGTIDTTTSATGTNLTPFIYKIGTNAHRVTVTMPNHNYEVLPDQLSVIHLEVNYAKLLKDIQLNVVENLNISTPEQNGWSWVTDLEDEIAAMFEYE